MHLTALDYPFSFSSHLRSFCFLIVLPVPHPTALAYSFSISSHLCSFCVGHCITSPSPYGSWFPFCIFKLFFRSVCFGHSIISLSTYELVIVVHAVQVTDLFGILNLFSALSVSSWYCLSVNLRLLFTILSTNSYHVVSVLTIELSVRQLTTSAQPFISVVSILDIVAPVLHHTTPDSPLVYSNSFPFCLFRPLNYLSVNLWLGHCSTCRSTYGPL